MTSDYAVYAILGLFTGGLVSLILSRSKSMSKQYIFPPGPQGVPFFGNLFQMPKTNWWFSFTELGARFGAMVHLSFANRHIVVIKSYETARKVLESTNAADRPQFTMAGELMGFGISIAFIGYGKRWRTYRRISHQAMSVNAVAMYSHMLEREAKRLIHALVQDPESFRQQTRFTVGRTIMDAMYGINCATADDTYIKVAEATLENISHAVMPGSFMVDAIPWLKHLPYLGLPFQKHVQIAKKQVQLMVERPFKQVLHDIENKIAKFSFTASLLEEDVKLDESDREDIISWAAATMYGAAGETMHATLLNFFLAMTKYPDIQNKAFKEIDAMVGSLRCPSFADRKSLPYVNALIKELTRWRVALPLGVPHACHEDSRYDDYFFPRGTIIIANVWSISQDPSYYKDPLLFNPERFLKEQPELDPFSFVFGFGPRICVGKNFAISQLYILVVSLLWAFEITPIDNEGAPDPPYSSGFVSAPIPFRCKITPRHSGVEEITHD